MPDPVRRTVVLFQPKDGCRVMPLGLLHVGSALQGFTVEIVDGRLDLAPEARVAELSREALCLGVSVPSGRPVAEAFRVTRAARAVRPGLFVVWGGAHATYRPEHCLVPGGADACVSGPGEGPFRAIVDALGAGRRPGPVGGVTIRDGEGVAAGPVAEVVRMENLAPVDYGLLDLDRHFRLRGVRGIDYCSSRLADDGSWQGLPAERVSSEVAGLARRFRLSEVRMADAEFFSDLPRALAIARGLVVAGVRLRWYARTSGRSSSALSSSDWELLRASGLARLQVPASADGGRESALTVEERAKLARTIRDAGLGAAFTWVVGRPGEDHSVAARAIDEARAVRGICSGFETSIRYWAGWPSQAPAMAAGQVEPEDEAAWATCSMGEGPGAWVSDRTRDLVTRRRFFLERAFERTPKGAGKRLVHWVARARLRTGFYRMDFDRRVIELSRRLRGGGRSLDLRCDE